MTQTFYKATRPDGGSFADPSVVYEVGRTVRPVKSSSRQICGPGFLHAADVPTETLVTGLWPCRLWPCRLFEVSGKPAAGFDEDHPHKGGFRQLRVVRELPAHTVFGPQGEEVVALIDRAGRLTFDEEQQLEAAWYAPRFAAWDAAWDAARDAVRDAAWDAARDAVRFAAWDAPRYAARYAAWDAARDAAGALVARDLISSKHYDVLYGPWREVIEAA